jgi:hypothetical protein
MRQNADLRRLSFQARSQLYICQSLESQTEDIYVSCSKGHNTLNRVFSVKNCSIFHWIDTAIEFLYGMLKPAYYFQDRLDSPHIETRPERERAIATSRESGVATKYVMTTTVHYANKTSQKGTMSIID